MKTSKVTALLLTAAFLAMPVFADPKEKSGRKNNQKQDEYVMVTGSHIPKLVRPQIVLTANSDVRSYDRKAIDQSGRVTTESFLALDPAAQVIMGHPGGIR